MREQAESPPSRFRRAHFISSCSEGLLLAVLCLTPWAFGAVGVPARLCLLVATSAIFGLWWLQQYALGVVAIRSCAVSVFFALTLLLGLVQVVALPEWLLSITAPGIAELKSALLPELPEIVTEASGDSSQVAGRWQSLSLYVGASREALVPLLALFVIFFSIRNGSRNEGYLRRFFWVISVNGVALALFGLIQFFSTPERGKIYWTYESLGSAFGPFINRNHFAFYINMCMGAAIGLLVASGTGAHREPVTHTESRLLSRVRELLHHPHALWFAFGLSLMLASLVVCLSRGGFVAMIVSSLACVLLTITGHARGPRITAVVIAVAAAVALLYWFGLESIESRLSTLWNGKAAEDARVFVFANAWRLVSQFPLLGTGIGTFQFVEPLALHTPEDVGTLYEHAHNDYVEDLIEGGIVRLALRIGLIVSVFRYAMVAYRQNIGKPEAGWVLGLLYSFTSIVVHSAFEFGLYVPAIALLAIVLCGWICRLSDTPDQADFRLTRSSSFFRPFMFVSFFGVLLQGWFFIQQGTLEYRVESIEKRLTSIQTESFDGIADLSSALPELYRLANLKPLDAERRFALAEAHFHLYKRLESHKEEISIAQAAREQLRVGLGHTIAARNLCPILPEAQTRLAAYADVMVRADSATVYMNRAKRLAPADPKLWYICGLQELESGRDVEAWNNWRQSLALSEIGLNLIIERALTQLTPDEVMEKVVPNNPSTILAAAMCIYPDPDATAERRPFLEKALRSFGDESKMLEADFEIKAKLLRLLDRLDEAASAYRQALQKDPANIATRLNLATLYLQKGDEKAASRELTLILGMQPNHDEAKRILTELKQTEGNR